MQHISGEAATLMLKSDQGRDTFEQLFFGESVLARLLSFRCAEAAAQNLPGQDYACVCSNAQGTSISFCICDGVGSSYKGDVAAQYLATRLVDWLQAYPMIAHRPARFVRALQPQLERWAGQAQELLSSFEIGPEVPALVREVLDELRTTHGSETVFFCGRIDSSMPAAAHHHHGYLHGAHPEPTHFRAVFCWMGNVCARLYLPFQSPQELGDASNDSNRWSTVRGQWGKLSLSTLTFDAIDRLLVYTDGVASLADSLADHDDEALQAEARTLRLSPVSDDMTVLDMRWLTTDAVKEGTP